MSARSKLWIAFTSASVGCATALLLSSAGAEPGDTYSHLIRFSRALAHIENSHFSPPDGKRLVDGAIRGMVEALDPHSAFLSSDQVQALRQSENRHEASPGLVLTVQPHAFFGIQVEQLTVVAPEAGSPAARAGIEPGDQILHIDGHSTMHMDPLVAQALLAGEADSRVIVGVLRKGFRAVRDIPLVRALPRPRLVEQALWEKVGYLRLGHVSPGADQAIADAIKALRQQGGGALAGLILDLRNNPGGLIDEAVRIADRFLPGNLPIVTIEGRGGAVLERRMSHAEASELDLPLVLLVNGGTASAAEIIAAALRDHGRAQLVGARTFGKGSAQTIIEFDDGSLLRLTMAHYLTPKGLSLHGRGLAPDRGVSALESAPERLDFPGNLTDSPPPEPPATAQLPGLPASLEEARRDPFLDAALDEIEKKRASSGSISAGGPSEVPAFEPK